LSYSADKSLGAAPGSWHTRSVMSKRGAVLVGCSLLGCGGGTAVPPAKAPATPAVAVADAPRANNHPLSAELSAYWVLQEPLVFSLRADVTRISATPLFQQLLPLLAENASVFRGLEPACVQALAAHARDLAMGATEQLHITTVALGADGISAIRASCSSRLQEKGELKGAPEAYVVGEDWLTFLPTGVALLGSKPLVEDALDPGRPRGKAPQHFALEADEMLSFVVAPPETGVAAGGTLSLSPSRFLLKATAEVADESLLAQTEAQLAAMRGKLQQVARAPGGDPSLARVLESFHFERRGKALDFGLDLRGSAADQARDLGTLVALGVSGAQRYMANAKAVEAKVTLAAITKAYQASLKGGPAKAKHKLVSLKAVPTDVPRGQKYQSSAADWTPWATIGFSITEPQYFQYEVVAAKDGKSAEIIARGDLDGDGELSETRLTIELDPKTSQLTAKDLQERNPLE